MTNVLIKAVALGSILFLANNVLQAQEEMHRSELATHTGVYLEPKFMVVLGGSISHEGTTLEGSSGYGIGFDLGYSFTEYFALELDVTQSQTDVTESGNNHSVTDKANFYTYGINSVLTYPIANHFLFLGKLGYGYEYEDLGELDIKGTENGATWALGLEYSFNPHVEMSLEYESSKIRSARGDAVQLGLIYKF